MPETVKEHPILFSGAMVRAILSGTKTQTRRVIGEHHLQQIDTSKGRRTANWSKPMPYGRPGEWLWVREAWRTAPEADALPPRELNEAHRIWYEADTPHQPGFGKLRPGMFMPRWASRITLDVTSVRMERLQDISEEDALAEGVFKKVGRHGPYDAVETATDDLLIYASPTQAREVFQRLWSQMSGPGSWDANPWVWVVEFRRLESAHV